jgi:predicted phosphodiesterase
MSQSSSEKSEPARESTPSQKSSDSECKLKSVEKKPSSSSSSSSVEFHKYKHHKHDRRHHTKNIKTATIDDEDNADNDEEGVQNEIESSNLAKKKTTYIPFKFTVISDLHVKKNNGGRQYDKLPRILKRINTDPTMKAVIFAGDLTDHGYEDHKNECTTFKTKWFEPLKKAIDSNKGKIGACLGNHDAPQKFGKIPDIVKYVDDHCGDPYFNSFDINGVHFACMYMHPGHWDVTISVGFSSSTIINSLIQMDLDLNSHKNSPTILIWHLPMDGPMGDWWNGWEKDLALKVLKKYNNIKHICVGHLHSPQFTTLWNDKYKVSYVGGSRYLVVGAVDSKGEITMNFYDSKENLKTWEDLYRPVDDITKTKLTKDDIAEIDSEMPKPPETDEQTSNKFTSSNGDNEGKSLPEFLKYILTKYVNNL